MKTPDELFEDLQPWMRAQFKDEELLREANLRLMGARGGFRAKHSGGTTPFLSQAVARIEPTGLCKYGENHLRPDWDGVKFAREEVIDAINQLGPMTQFRIDNGLEDCTEWKDVKRGYALAALQFALAILSLLEENDGQRETEEHDTGVSGIPPSEPDGTVDGIEGTGEVADT